MSQLRAQLQLYTTLPGLDPGGGIIGALEQEITELAQKQAAKFAKLDEETKAKQAELAEQKRLAALEPPSVEELLSKAKGTFKPEISAEAKALLDKLV